MSDAIIERCYLTLDDANFIDVHYHANPDAYIRRHSAWDAGRLYAEAGGWVVLKNHLGCTAAQAYECRSTGLPVSGSIVLNEIAGGLDWRVVEGSLCKTHETNGRLIVHFPTVTGRQHASRLSRSISHAVLRSHPIEPLTISDSAGNLKPEMDEIFRLACDHPVVLSTGHASRSEVFRFIDAALRRNVPRVMLNQPANPMTGLSAGDLREISSLDSVFIEQCAITYMLGYQSRDDFEEVLCDIRQVVYSSDLGQVSQPDIGEWLRLSDKWFDEFGISKERRRQIMYQNPLNMLL